MRSWRRAANHRRRPSSSRAGYCAGRRDACSPCARPPAQPWPRSRRRSAQSRRCNERERPLLPPGGTKMETAGATLATLQQELRALQKEMAPATAKTDASVTEIARQLADQLDTRAKARFAKENLADRAAEARVKGYEGESCQECGNFTLVRNGTCLKCDTCGGTSGCS